MFGGEDGATGVAEVGAASVRAVPNYVAYVARKLCKRERERVETTREKEREVRSMSVRVRTYIQF